jgi:hypothetical protein
MNVGRTVFSQLIEYLPSKEFQKCVARYHGDSRFRGFSCWDQLLAMFFAQLTYRESLRDIEACLRFMSGKLYHMGLRGKVARSTLGEAKLTAMARELVTENGVGESAAAVWRHIQAENSNVLTPATNKPEPEAVVEDPPLPASLTTPALTVEAGVNALKFGSRPLSARQPIRRREAGPGDLQFPLF